MHSVWFYRILGALPFLRLKGSKESLGEDSTIPLLLGSKRAVDVIRKFKAVEGDAPLSAVKAMQGAIFGRIDKLERVKLDDDVPEAPFV